MTRRIITGVLLVATMGLLWTRGVSPYDLVRASLLPTLFLLQMVALSTPARSLSVGAVWRFYALGMAVIAPLTLVLQHVMVALIPAFEPLLHLVLGGANLSASVVAPVTEELLKALPAVALLWLGGRVRPSRVLTPVDFGLVAGAAGAGFSVVENVARVLNGHTSSLWPTARVFPIFSELQVDAWGRAGLIFIGHGASAAVIGLSVGIAVYLWRRCRLFALLPLFTLVVATWDHFAWNFNVSTSTLWSILGWWTLKGRLLMVLAVLYSLWAVLLTGLALFGLLRHGGVRLFTRSCLSLRGLLRCVERYRLALNAAVGVRAVLLSGPTAGRTLAPWVDAMLTELRPSSPPEPHDPPAPPPAPALRL